MTKGKPPKANTSKTKQGKKTEGIFSKSVVRILLGLILAATFISFIPALSNDFVWDDSVYVQHNSLIYSINLSKIFSTYLAGNYHPLTVLVHAIEYQFFHQNPGGYHAVNLLLHVLNTALVFYFIKRLSKNVVIGLITALLFGLHPMHVESVAWISELKDVLYTFFFLAALITYQLYSSASQAKWYVLTLVLFLLSLLSKGMAVSLPLVLVLIDYYNGRLTSKKAWLEKAPFFTLSLIFGIIAIKAQQSEAALHGDVIGWGQRIVFASYSFVTYLQKLAIPYPLYAYYPYPVAAHQAIPVQYYLYPFFAMAIVGLAIYSYRKHPKVFFAIGFFTATIVLVLKFLPVSYALMADRYVYVPSIGAFFLAAAGIYKLSEKLAAASRKSAIMAFMGVAAIVLALLTSARCHVWENSLTLWSDTIEKNPNIPIAYGNRSVYYTEKKMFKEAMDDLNIAVKLNPDYADAYFNQGVALQGLNKPNEALQAYNLAIEKNPSYAKAYINRAIVLRDAGKTEEALVDYGKGIELDPTVPEAYNNRAILFQNQNRNEEAIRDYSKAIELRKDYTNAYINRGNVYSNIGQNDAAFADYNKAIELNTNTGLAYNNRAMLETKLKDFAKACPDFQMAVQLGYAPAQQNYDAFCRN